MKKLITFCIALLMINAAQAQVIKTAFCTRLDSVLNFFKWGKPELKAQQTSSDDYSLFYSSRIKLSTGGRAQVSVSKRDTYFKSFTEWVGEKLTQEKANALYDDYFSQLKTCLGEKFTEKSAITAGERWSYLYTYNYGVELKLSKEYETNNYMVYISIMPPEDGY